jgi:hypothetical protein
MGVGGSEQAAALEIEGVDFLRAEDHFEGELEEADLPGVIDTLDDGTGGIAGAVLFGEEAGTCFKEELLKLLEFGRQCA